MNTSTEASTETFDALCEKIAQGKASPEEVKLAFQELNRDIDSFSEDTQAQLKSTQS